MDFQKTDKRMKHLGFTVATAAFFGSLALLPSANAQSRGENSGSAQTTTSSQMVERRVAMLTSHLQLYSGQVVKIRAILTQERQQIAAIRNNVSGDTSRPDRSGPGPRARNAPLPDARSIRDRTEREIEKVLSTQQLAAYRTLREGKRLPNYFPQTRWNGFLS